MRKFKQMKVSINIVEDKQGPMVYLLQLNKKNVIKEIGKFDFTEKEVAYIDKQIERKIYLFKLSVKEDERFIQIISKEHKKEYLNAEEFRKAGSGIIKVLRKYGFSKVTLNTKANKEMLLSYLEGIFLADYTFNEYKTEKGEAKELKINVNRKNIQTELDHLRALAEGVYVARDIVNIPGSDLRPVDLSNKITSLGKEAGYFTEFFNKSKIKALKMGGLLAVNRGSLDPPTFNILEYKPDNAINTKPIMLVGKGIVFDTGGLSLKPTANSMDYMKSDKGGAAAVIGTFYAVAKAKLPIHIVGLIPATDNRPGQDAYYPGDVVKMYDGSTVEVLNTDAEGRMILADALVYAKKYKPELVIDLATLTGSAAIAVGKYGVVYFNKAGDIINQELQKSGDQSYERLVEFPLWEEYGEMLKSDVADVKNIGGREAGAITAAKFLERFTDYPWVHMDIAGPAFMHSEYNYYKKGGSGIGVRLLFNFLKNKTLK